MKVTNQDISPFPYYLPPVVISHLNLSGLQILPTDVREWSQILYLMATECGQSKAEVENMEIGEFLSYSQVCHEVLSLKVRKHQEAEREIERSRQAPRRF